MSSLLSAVLWSGLGALGAAAPALGLAPGELEVLPTERAFEALPAETFELEWVLPEPRTAPGPDLLVELRALLELRFDVSTADGARYRCFGDLAAAAQALEPEARRALYERFEQAAAPAADWRDRLGHFRRLLLDAHLHSDRWNPAKPHERDGLLLDEPWDLSGEGSPWDRLGVRPLAEQAAALLHADLASIKAVENDYRSYPDNVGADYEEIYPLAGTYFTGTHRPPGDAAEVSESPYSTLAIHFRCDLPFPFSSYTTRLAILNRWDAPGVLYTHIYSTSEDFHWLAGRDVFLPVTNADGQWVGLLLVRHFGFDLDGVPDRSSHRQEALRSSLGNLKRKAERLYAQARAAGGTPRNEPEFLPQVRVLGRK